MHLTLARIAVKLKPESIAALMFQPVSTMVFPASRLSKMNYAVRIAQTRKEETRSIAHYLEFSIVLLLALLLFIG